MKFTTEGLQRVKSYLLSVKCDCKCDVNMYHYLHCVNPHSKSSAHSGFAAFTLVVQEPRMNINEIGTRLIQILNPFICNLRYASKSKEGKNKDCVKL